MDVGERTDVESISRPPVVIFGFNRPKHLRICLESLVANRNSNKHRYFLFVDGPRTKEEENVVQQVVEVATLFKQKIDLEVIESIVNQGLSKSLISGITDILCKFDSIIVLEDDLELHPDFLNFMSANLEKYKDSEFIASIQGFTYPFLQNSSECYFLKGADCWGWGTWRRSWELLEIDSSRIVNQLRSQKLVRKFDMDGAFPYSRMLEREARGEVDSWAIRWHASMYLLGKLSLYPPNSLVRNNGFDGSGTHVSTRDEENFRAFTNFSYQIPVEICESKSARRRLIRYLRKKYGTYSVFHPIGFLARIKRRMLH
jgi:hypothetical protein